MTADPRDIVTEQAFRVEPTLLGTPLATPKRRLTALGIDFLLAALFSKVFGILLVGFLALLFFRSALRTEIRGFLSRTRYLALYAAAALCLLVAAISLADYLFPDFDDSEPPSQNDRDDFDAARREIDAQLEGGAISAESAQRGQQILDAVEPLVAEETAKNEGTSDVDIEDIRRFVTAIRPFVGEETQTKMDARLAELEAKALTATTATSSSSATGKSSSKTRSKPCPETEPWTPMSVLTAFFDSLGITFGWFGFYFTVAHTWGRGRSPGKRLLGLRVIRLDGRPLRLWDAFERFSGFGAGVATGLLGFLQIYWDPNRQAIHDKICATVVVREKPSK